MATTYHGQPVVTGLATSKMNLLQSHVHQAALSFERLLYFGTCRKANSHCSAIADAGDLLRKCSDQLAEMSASENFECVLPRLNSRSRVTAFRYEIHGSKYAKRHIVIAGDRLRSYVKFNRVLGVCRCASCPIYDCLLNAAIDFAIYPGRMQHLQLFAQISCSSTFFSMRRCVINLGYVIINC